MRFSDHNRFLGFRQLMRNYLEDSGDQIKEYQKEDMLMRVSAHSIREYLWLAQEVKASVSPNRPSSNPKELAAIVRRAEVLNREKAQLLKEGRFVRVPAGMFNDIKFLLDEADRFAEEPPPVPADGQPALTAGAGST